MGKMLEALRIISCIIGFYMAYATTAEHSLWWIVALVVIPLTFLSGIEGLFFASSSLVGKDWGTSINRYAIQGRLNFFAMTTTAIIILLCHMNIQAQLTLCLVAIIFFAMSSINHLLSFFFDSASKIQLERFVLTLALLGGFIPLLIRVKSLL